MMQELNSQVAVKEQKKIKEKHIDSQYDVA